MAKIFLLKATPYDPGAAAETTVYFSTHRPDGRAPVYNSVLWPNRLLTPLNTQVSVFTGEFGGGVPTFGVAQIGLVGGEQDALLGYYWDGRDVFVYRGEETDAFGSMALVFKGRVRSIQWDREVLTLNLADYGEVLGKPIQTTLYAGTGGAEGGPDLTGKPKPLAFGTPKNVEPTLVSAAYLVYQFHCRQANGVDGVYDRAVALSLSADYPDYATLTGAAVPAGTYATCNALGMIRLGATPDGPVTADVTGDADGGFVYTAADIMGRIAVDFTDLTVPDTDSAAFTALNTANGSPCSVYIGTGDNASVTDVFTQLMVSVGAFWTFTPAGLLTVKQVAFGTSAVTLSDSYGPLVVDGVARMETPPPYWRSKFGFARSWRVHGANEIAAAAAGGSIGIKINMRTFTEPEAGKALIHGLAADGTPTDTDGSYIYGGQVITLPRAQFVDTSTLHTSQPVSTYIVHDTDPITDVVVDNFAGANNTNLTAHAPDIGTAWTKVVGTPNLLLDGAGKVKASATGTDRTIYTVAPAPSSANYAVECQIDTWSTTATKDVSLIGRLVDSSNFYSARIWCVSSGVYGAQLRKYVGGTATILTGVSIMPTVGQKFRLKMVGSTISLWTRGPSDVTWTQLASVTDTSFASAGKPGLAQGAGGTLVGSDTTWRASAFRARSLQPIFTFGGPEYPAVVLARYSAPNWQYDDTTGWVNFTPTESMLIIGTATRDSSGLVSAEMTLPQKLGADDSGTLITRSNFVREAQRFVISSDSAVKTKHKLAREREVASLLDNESEADTENDRQHALLDAKWDLYQVPVQRSVIDDYSLTLGATLTLRLARFGLTAGRDFIIGGMATGRDADETILTLFG